MWNKKFDWAKYKQEKGAIKLHTMLDYDGCLPKYVYMYDRLNGSFRKYINHPLPFVPICHDLRSISVSSVQKICVCFLLLVL